MRSASVPSSNLGDDWTAEHHVVQAEEVSTQPLEDHVDSATPVSPYYGETTHPDCSPETGHVCQEPSGQTCWTVGCELPAGTKWGPYWCPDHDAERIDRISREMGKIMQEVEEKKSVIDPAYIPRNYGGIGRPYTAEELDSDSFDKGPVPDPHIIAINGEWSEWRWSCTCGKGSSAPTSTQGTASAAAARHIRATKKAAS